LGTAGTALNNHTDLLLYSTRRSAGDAAAAGGGADALYLCMLALLFQPGDVRTSFPFHLHNILSLSSPSSGPHRHAQVNLQRRLGSDCLSEMQSSHVTETDEGGASQQLEEPTVEEVVMLLLSKLEPSGILDRQRNNPPSTVSLDV
jgi:hypothetical protein